MKGAPPLENSAPLGPPEGKMLTVPEVAAQLRVTKMTVYRLCHSGDLPHIRVGRGFRIFDRALHRFLLAGGSDPSQFEDDSSTP